MSRRAIPRWERHGPPSTCPDCRHDVHGAGGVVLRPLRGRHQIAVVHRAGRDDWSLPKGKLASGESFEQCALREVEEETGWRCELVRFVGRSEYRDRRGRAKLVAYWLMDPVEGEFSPGAEVDDMRWLELEIAKRALTYQRDRDLLSILDTMALARSG